MGQEFHIDNNYYRRPQRFGNVTLIQLGRRYSHPNTQIATTHEDFFELTIVLSGRGKILIDQTEVEVSKGDIHLAGPYEYHEIQPHSKEPIRYDFFAFHVEDEALAERLRDAIRTHRTAKERVFHDESIPTLVAGAIRELQSKTFGWEAILEHSLAQILIHLVRAFAEVTEGRQLTGETDAQILCYRTMHYIDKHLDSIRHLSEVAAELRYNYAYLSDLFHRVCGQTMTEYLTERRLEACRAALAEGELSVTLVAEKWSYPSLSSFSRAFKRRYGVSPERYRREHTKQKE